MKKFISGFLVGVLVIGLTSFALAEDKSQTLVSKIYQNTFGDVFRVYAKNDTLQAKLGTADGKGDNIGGTLVLFNNDESKPRVSSGIRKDTDSGVLTLQDNNNKTRLLLSGEQKDTESGLFLYDKNGNCVTSIRQSAGFINNQQIVTQDELLKEIEKLQKQIDDLKKLK